LTNRASGDDDYLVSGNAKTTLKWVPHRLLTLASWDRYAAFGAAYRRALSDTSDSFGLNDLFVSGRDVLLTQEDLKEAIAAFMQVIQTTPEEDGAWSNLAWLYAISGDTVKAVAAEQKAISLYKYDYSYYVLLGAYFEQSGRIDDAQSAYGHALTLYPRLEYSDFWHALHGRRQDLATAAVHSALMMLDHEQPATGNIKRSEVRARLMDSNGMEHEASNIVLSLNAQLPNISGTWELQGELREKEGNSKDAELDYHRAAFLDKTDPLPHERLLILELNEHDMEDARIEAIEGWRLTQRLRSIGSTRRTVQYHQNSGPRNGLLPRTLLQETQPTFDYSVSFLRLSVFFRSRGQVARADEMEEMADWATASADSYEDTHKSPP
jgi:tetratricopeptide (TPR) repeat protein